MNDHAYSQSAAFSSESQGASSMTSASTSSNVAPPSIISAMRDCRFPVVMGPLLALRAPEKAPPIRLEPARHLRVARGTRTGTMTDAAVRVQGPRPAFSQTALNPLDQRAWQLEPHARGAAPADSPPAGELRNEVEAAARAKLAARAGVTHLDPDRPREDSQRVENS